MQEKTDTIDWRKIVFENYESAEAGIRTNYYGAKGMCEALIPLLELSDSPRIVSVSSSMGKLEVCDTMYNCLYVLPCLESQSGSHLIFHLEVIKSL